MSSKHDLKIKSHQTSLVQDWATPWRKSLEGKDYLQIYERVSNFGHVTHRNQCPATPAAMWSVGNRYVAFGEVLGGTRSRLLTRCGGICHIGRGDPRLWVHEAYIFIRRERLPNITAIGYCPRMCDTDVIQQSRLTSLCLAPFVMARSRIEGCLWCK